MFGHYLAAILGLLSFPAVAQQYQATTTVNAIVRQAPGLGFAQIGLIPVGTEITVEICFNRGAYCMVEWGGARPGFVSGELMTIGTTAQTVRGAEQARWQALETAKPRVTMFAAAEERCDPWVDPAAGANQPVGTLPSQTPADAAPPRFPDVSHAGSAPELVFLGDSLTNEPLASMTAEMMGGRAYRVFQIGGQDATLLSNLFLTEDVAPEAVGIIWIGRNSNPADVRTVIGDIEKAAGHIPSGKYIVIDFLSGRYPGEQPGELRRGFIDRLNEAISRTFGQRSVHIRPTISCTDYQDAIHLLESGEGKVAAAIAAALAAQGW